MLSAGFAKNERAEIIVVAVIENPVAVDHSGRDDIGDLPPDDPLRLRRILYLVANSHLEAFLHQPGNVTLAGMMRKARHGNIGR